jgi:hypothetical protein
MQFGLLGRAGLLAGFCAMLAGCAGHGVSTPGNDLAYNNNGVGGVAVPAAPAEDPTLFPDDGAGSAPGSVEGAHLECVPYAREHSGVNIRGDAYTWWDKAAGVYARTSLPTPGAVMVLAGYAGRHRAHVAVVKRLISPREIRIDHANWLDDGAIYVNDPVLDVSADNDWTQVKVWNIRSGSWGTKVYMVKGFIGPGPANPSPVVASYTPAPSDPIGLQIAATDR